MISTEHCGNELTSHTHILPSFHINIYLIIDLQPESGYVIYYMLGKIVKVFVLGFFSHKNESLILPGVVSL